MHSLLAKRLQPVIGAGFEAALVKGPVFAARLYRLVSDRPYTDIDLLVAASAREAVSGALERAGFVRLQKAVFDRSSAYEEQKWSLPDIPEGLLEVHANLVHYPALRRKVSFGYRELVAAGDGDPEAPPSLFFTAVVHASLGHKFHQLRMLVDILQAWRNLGPEDRRSLAALARALGLETETSVCLTLVSDLFDEPGARDVAVSLAGTPAARAASMLVDAPTLLAAPRSRLSWLRRHAFRVAQHLRR
jgi:hypothetical protein